MGGAYSVYNGKQKTNKKAKVQRIYFCPSFTYIVGVMPYALASLVFIFSDINSITNISAKPAIINAMAMQN